jgi:hypothetical protein
MKVEVLSTFIQYRERKFCYFPQGIGIGPVRTAYAQPC